MSNFLSATQYKLFLESKKMSELKNIITSVVKHVRFTLTGRKKQELIDHLVANTWYDVSKKNFVLMGNLEKAPLVVRDTYLTAKGVPRKIRSDNGKKKPKPAPVVVAPVAKPKRVLKKIPGHAGVFPKPEVMAPVMESVAKPKKVLKKVPGHAGVFTSKERKKRSDAGVPRKKKIEKTI